MHTHRIVIMRRKSGIINTLIVHCMILTFWVIGFHGKNMLVIQMWTVITDITVSIHIIQS